MYVCISTGQHNIHTYVRMYVHTYVYRAVFTYVCMYIINVYSEFSLICRNLFSKNMVD